MIILLDLFGVFLVIAGICLVMHPGFIFSFLEENSDSLGLYTGAIGARVILGILFLYDSDVSRFPRVMFTLGCIALFAAAFFMLMGRRKFKKLILAVVKKALPVARAGGVASVSFGAFLIYAFT